jgi:hypothetical protein
MVPTSVAFMKSSHLTPEAAAAELTATNGKRVSVCIKNTMGNPFRLMAALILEVLSPFPHFSSMARVLTRRKVMLALIWAPM